MSMCEVNILIKKNVTMCLHLKLIDGDNVTASDDSDADSDRDGGYKAKMDKFGINHPLL